MSPNSEVHRVYATFNSIEEFTEKAIQAIAGLRRFLDGSAPPVHRPVSEADPIPTSPDFYAEPRYIGSHKFVGRRAQLDGLNDWAVAADPHPVIFFDAIGGSGKSMLTWEWATNHAAKIRANWAGRFWYSFYERGAIMADFCQHALAYVTGQPLEGFKKMKTPQLGEQLLHHLQSRPWLFILDGLERVLVAYHRYDAAQVTDEEVNQPTDQIAHRDPCAAIRPEDDDLLRSFAADSPSKLVITSRLVPRVLLNSASQAIPGVLRVALPGLRPPDAELLFRSCGVTGGSQAIQNYLKSHCDCHPLVTGVLAGLVTCYFPDRGNFDTWEVDTDGGGQLNLAILDLVQKRNHILQAAVDRLPEKSRQLLPVLALLSGSVDYVTLSSFNPHLPPEPEEVDVPGNPEGWPRWGGMSDELEGTSNTGASTCARTAEGIRQVVGARLRSPEFLTVQRRLSDTVGDLEHRGPLQYDAQSRRYDLHPVVRGVAAGGLRPDEAESYGQRVVDHFSAQAHSPYEEAEVLDDLRNSLQIVRTLLKMGRHGKAYETYRGDLSNALLLDLEACLEVLSLLRPLFPQGWATLPEAVDEGRAMVLANNAGFALDALSELDDALAAHGAALRGAFKTMDWENASVVTLNISRNLNNQNRLAQQDRWTDLSLDLAALSREEGAVFVAGLHRFRQLLGRPMGGRHRNVVSARSDGTRLGASCLSSRRRRGSLQSPRRRLMLSDGQEGVVFLSWDAATRVVCQIEARVFVDRNNPGWESVVDLAFFQLIQDSCRDFPVAICLHSFPKGAWIEKVAMGIGFRRIGGADCGLSDAFGKFALGRPVTPSSWDEVADIVYKVGKVRLPEAVPTFRGSMTAIPVTVLLARSFGFACPSLRSCLGPRCSPFPKGLRQ